jgi:hypothetical protein
MRPAKKVGHPIFRGAIEQLIRRIEFGADQIRALNVPAVGLASDDITHEEREAAARWLDHCINELRRALLTTDPHDA